MRWRPPMLLNFSNFSKFLGLENISNLHLIMWRLQRLTPRSYACGRVHGAWVAASMPLVSKHVRHFLELFDDRWPWPLTCWTENCHTSYSCPVKCSHEFYCSTPLFEHIRDRQTDGRAGNIMQPIGGPHNKITSDKNQCAFLNYLQWSVVYK